MKNGHAAWFIAGYVLIIFSLAMPRHCAGQTAGQYNMQNSAEMQNFKAQQQQKSQAYLAKYDQENKEFMSTVMSMQREEKINAFKEFLSGQYEKNYAFRKQMHDEMRAFLQKQLD